jgi:hypothetical protein
MKSGSMFCVSRLHVTDGLSISLKKGGSENKGPKVAGSYDEAAASAQTLIEPYHIFSSNTTLISAPLFINFHHGELQSTCVAPCYIWRSSVSTSDPAKMGASPRCSIPCHPTIRQSAGEIQREASQEGPRVRNTSKVYPMR